MAFPKTVVFTSGHELLYLFRSILKTFIFYVVNNGVVYRCYKGLFGWIHGCFFGGIRCWTQCCCCFIGTTLKNWKEFFTKLSYLGTSHDINTALFLNISSSLVVITRSEILVDKMAVGLLSRNLYNLLIFYSQSNSPAWTAHSFWTNTNTAINKSIFYTGVVGNNL